MSQHCAQCNNPPQLSVMSDCGTGCVYCFLCLKDYIGSANGVCKCGLPITIDIDHVSKDFKTQLETLNGKPVWLYSSASSDGWWMYNLSTSDQLEYCFNGGLPTCSFHIGKKTYNANFTSNTQTLVTGGSTQRPMKRAMFTADIIDQLNIKGIAGVYFKTIENQIGKFV